MLPIHLQAMLRLLAYSWADAEFEYEGLTDAERLCISKDEFEDTVRLMVAHDVIKMELTEDRLIPYDDTGGES